MSDGSEREGMEVDSGDLVGEVQQLRIVVEDLCRRVRYFEDRWGVDGEEELAAAGPDDAQGDEATQRGGSARLLNHLALVCFVLVGALALRIVARQAWISPTTGTVCGLVYCLALMMGPGLIWKNRTGPAALLSACGGLLWPLIVLEMTHRAAMGPGVAAALLTGGAALGALTGALHRWPTLTAVVLLAQLGGIMALGLTPDGAPVRGAGLAIIAGLALVVAHLRGWPFLRPLLLLPVGLGLSLGVLLTAQRAPLSAEVTPALLVAVVTILALLVGSLALRAGSLDAFERACLPVAATLTYWLAAFSHLAVAPLIAGACAVAALALAWVLGRRHPRPALYPGLAATGALLLLSILPRLDPSGLLLALGALVVQRLGRARAVRLEPALALLLVVAATLTSLLAGAASWPPPWRAVAALGLALLLVAHTRAARGEQTWRSTISFCCLAVLVYFSSLRLAGLYLTVGALGLLQTGLLACMSVLALGLGRWWPELRYAGYAGLALLGAKVVLWDMSLLDGPFLVGAVLILGVTAAVTSLLLRLWRARDEG